MKKKIIYRAANAQVLVEIIAEHHVDLRALPNVQIHVKLRHRNLAQVVLMAALGIVLRLVQMHAKLRHHNIVLIVQIIVQAAVQKHVLILVKPKLLKDVVDVVQHVKLDAVHNVIGVVAGLVMTHVQVIV